jgi:hypothetical protein
MSKKKYLVKKGDSGLYNLYRKVGVDYKYQMAFVHYDIAVQACHLLNLEAMSFDGMHDSWRKVHDELEDLRREFFEYRLEHPADDDD